LRGQRRNANLVEVFTGFLFNPEFVKNYRRPEEGETVAEWSKQVNYTVYKAPRDS